MYNKTLKYGKRNELELMIQVSEHKHIFIVGLHRSGTSFLADYLKEHPQISGFKNTSFPKDEGQFLQTVFPIAKTYGGPGKFGFKKESHLTESSDLLTTENTIKLHEEWNAHWDLSKEYLLEKSPPSLLKTRFLQEIFQNTYFIYIKRHPIAVSYATQKMSTANIPTMLKHWVVCNNIFMQDKPYLKNVHSITYEELVKYPTKTMNEIYDFLKINRIEHAPELNNMIDKEINEKYFSLWKKDYNSFTWFEKLNFKVIDFQLKKYDYTLKVI